MRIQCPECTASYVVPDKAIGENGRTVKCAKCGNNWKQMPPESPVDVPEQDIQDLQRAPSPALMEQQPATWKKWAVPVCVWLLALGAYNFPGYAEMFGVYDTRGLAFANMKVKIERENNKLVAVFDGAIINEGEDEVLPEVVNVQLFSGQQRVMAEMQQDVADVPIMPGETMPFSPTMGNISGNAKHLVLDIGSSFEASYRPIPTSDF